jgi:cytochrome c
MKLLAATLFTLAATANIAFAADDLPKKGLCMACHAVNDKVMGPSFKAIAAKYAGQKDAVDKLAQQVLKGTKGVPPGTPQWGNIPMPAVTQVSEAEARQLVQWVLSTK